MKYRLAFVALCVAACGSLYCSKNNDEDVLPDIVGREKPHDLPTVPQQPTATTPLPRPDASPYDAPTTPDAAKSDGATDKTSGDSKADKSSKDGADSGASDDASEEEDTAPPEVDAEEEPDA